jgi:hypothetical protein
VLSALTFFVGGLTLLWGITSVTPGAESDSFLNVESHLLKFETFSQADAVAMLDSSATHNLSTCDNHAQRALLLLEIPLADAALRAGTIGEFDRRSRSLETRARNTLSCSPRDSLVWLLLFGMEIQHGRLDPQTFALLSMSYDTSPNEAWIAVRRVVVATPVLLAAPDTLQQKILMEFRELVRRHLIEMPARAYRDAPVQVRALLQAEIDELGATEKMAFKEALKKLGS